MGSRERAAREKAEHRRGREALILSEAEKLFLQKGFIAATISEIAAACELTNGAIYIYYKNKDELVLKVMTGISLHFAELLKEAADAAVDLSGMQHLEKLLDVYNRTFKEYRSYHLLDAQFNMMFSQSYPEGPLLQEYFAANKMVLNIITDAAVKGMKDGSINSDLPAERLAGLLLNAVNSYVEKISLRGGLMEREQGISLDRELSDYLKLLLKSFSVAEK